MSPKKLLQKKVQPVADDETETDTDTNANTDTDTDTSANTDTDTSTSTDTSDNDTNQQPTRTATTIAYKFKPITTFDINVKEHLMHKSNGLNEHYLQLTFTGADMNIKIVNTLRRLCTNYIPIYGYAPELIKFTENTATAFNNDMMRMSLSLLPIMNVDPQLDELEEKYWYNVNYADPTREIHPNEKVIEFYVNKQNTGLSYERVTTNDATVMVDGERVEMYSKEYPILLIELHPNQSFKCHMRGVLGIGERYQRGAIWKSARNAYYSDVILDETDSKYLSHNSSKNNNESNESNSDDDTSSNTSDDSKKEYLLTIYGNDQYSEYELILRSCTFIIRKIAKIRANIKEQVAKGIIIPNQNIIIALDNEDHTVGEFINHELQDHLDISHSGVIKTDLLVKSITFDIRSESESPIKAIIETLDRLENKFNQIGNRIHDAYKKSQNKKH